jgi:hypothetical protein
MTRPTTSDSRPKAHTHGRHAIRRFRPMGNPAPDSAAFPPALHGTFRAHCHLVCYLSIRFDYSRKMLELRERQQLVKHGNYWHPPTARHYAATFFVTRSRRCTYNLIPFALIELDLFQHQQSPPSSHFDKEREDAASSSFLLNNSAGRLCNEQTLCLGWKNPNVIRQPTTTTITFKVAPAPAAH